MKKRLLIVPAILLLAAACTQNPTPQKEASIPSEEQQKIQTNVKVALIALEDNGKNGEVVGCNDSVVYINKEADDAQPLLNTAFEELFTLDSTWIKAEEHQNLWKGTGDNIGLYNTLHQSQSKDFARALKFNRAEIKGETAIIHLDGEITSGGTCDDPRFKAQIEKTAMQFPNVKNVEVYLNNQKLDWANYGSQK
jgi:hypothetical protein